MIATLLLVSNIALAQKQKEKVEEIRLPDTVLEREIPTEPSFEVYSKWQQLAGVPKVKFFFIGIIHKDSCLEWFYKPNAQGGYDIVGVRDLTTKIVYWKGAKQ